MIPQPATKRSVYEESIFSFLKPREYNNARRGNIMADSFVNMAQAKQRRWRKNHRIRKVEKNFINDIKHNKIKTARRESFLPAIHATACVNTG
jgi:hypothetical protein